MQWNDPTNPMQLLQVKTLECVILPRLNPPPPPDITRHKYKGTFAPIKCLFLHLTKKWWLYNGTNLHLLSQWVWVNCLGNNRSPLILKLICYHFTYTLTRPRHMLVICENNCVWLELMLNFASSSNSVSYMVLNELQKWPQSQVDVQFNQAYRL